MGLVTNNVIIASPVDTSMMTLVSPGSHDSMRGLSDRIARLTCLLSGVVALMRTVRGVGRIGGGATGLGGTITGLGGVALGLCNGRLGCSLAVAPRRFFGRTLNHGFQLWLGNATSNTLPVGGNNLSSQTA